MGISPIDIDLMPTHEVKSYLKMLDDDIRRENEEIKRANNLK